MPTLMQKIRLALRGWSRRREEREREFLAKNAGWGNVASGAPLTPSLSPQSGERVQGIDMEGLTVAYLDDSGQFHHYLDIETGEVLETRDPLNGDRYRRVPSRTSEAEDRRAFIATVEDSGARARLHSTAPESFRAELARDRALERAWYNFRNDRAIAAIQTWLREMGLK